MRKLLLIITLLAGLASARAQYFWSTNNLTLIGGTNNVLNAATNNYGDVIQVWQGQYVAVQCSFKMVAAGASSNVVFTFHQSVDGFNWHSNAWQIAAAAQGTTPVITVSNLPIGSAGYLMCGQVRNTNTVSATNLLVAVGYKPGI